MAGLHLHPNNIITNYIGVSSIIVSHQDDIVTLFGVYGNLLNGSLPTIEFHLSFYQLNELLSAIPSQSDTAIEQIAIALNEPQDDHAIIDLAAEGGLHFHNHIFSFQLVYNVDEENNPVDAAINTYLLLAYLPLNGMLPDFIHTAFPSGKDYLPHLHKVLAAQYKLFLYFTNILTQEQALGCSNLADPLSFALAREYHSLLNKDEIS